MGANHSRQDYESFSSKPLIISRPFLQGDQTIPTSLSDKPKNLDEFLKPLQPLLGEAKFHEKTASGIFSPAVRRNRQKSSRKICGIPDLIFFHSISFS